MIAKKSKLRSIARKSATDIDASTDIDSYICDNRQRPSLLWVLVLAAMLLFVLLLIVHSKNDQEVHLLKAREVILEASNEHTFVHNELLAYSNPLNIAPRLLFMAASYKMDQFLYLQKLLDVMRDHCNAGWNVTVHLQVAGEFSQQHPRYAEIIDRAYCIRDPYALKIIIENYDEIGFGLNCKHRIYIREHMDDFDYFSYAEEDMLLSVSHLKAFLHAEADLKAKFPTAWKRFVPGFLRWEDSTVDSERVSWEYFPDKIHILKIGFSKYIVTNNQNQAIFVFSREQLMDLQLRCNFLYDIGQNSFYKALRRALDQDWKYMSVGVSEWSSSFQHVLQCGIRRVIPLEHYELFMIQHSTNKAQSRRLRKELLTALDWKRIVRQKSSIPITLLEYDSIVSNQYNLPLIEKKRFAGKSIWDFNFSSTDLLELSQL